VVFSSDAAEGEEPARVCTGCQGAPESSTICAGCARLYRGSTQLATWLRRAVKEQPGATAQEVADASVAQGFLVFSARTGGLPRLPLEERTVLASKRTVVVFGPGAAGGEEEPEESGDDELMQPMQGDTKRIAAAVEKGCIGESVKVLLLKGLEYVHGTAAARADCGERLVPAAEQAVAGAQAAVAAARAAMLAAEGRLATAARAHATARAMQMHLARRFGVVLPGGAVSRGASGAGAGAAGAAGASGDTWTAALRAKVVDAERKAAARTLEAKARKAAEQRAAAEDDDDDASSTSSEEESGDEVQQGEAQARDRDGEAQPEEESSDDESSDDESSDDDEARDDEARDGAPQPKVGDTTMSDSEEDDEPQQAESGDGITSMMLLSEDEDDAPGIMTVGGGASAFGAAFGAALLEELNTRIAQAAEARMQLDDDEPQTPRMAPRLRALPLDGAEDRALVADTIADIERDPHAGVDEIDFTSARRAREAIQALLDAELDTNAALRAFVKRAVGAALLAEDEDDDA
jgi:hypothetical protein